MEHFLRLFFLLLCGHALADFSLQTDVMAKGKNRHNKTTPPPGAKYQPTWKYWLSAHALINGLAVSLITGIWWFGVLEAIIHWLTDFMKCDNRFGIHTDQSIHILSKFYWAITAAIFL